MTELALNILDIANNSTRAQAKTVTVSVEASTAEDILKISISDDGSGVSPELLARVSDPFATTRTTRKVGMGIPLFKMAATMADGEFAITSTLGKGTVTAASFKLSHVDRVPLGDLAGSFVTLVGGAPGTDFLLNYKVDGNEYTFSTQEVKEVLGESDLSDPAILSYLQDMINENIVNINGGITI